MFNQPDDPGVSPDHQTERSDPMFAGKQKAWMALVMPGIVTAIFAVLDMLGIILDPTVQTGAIMVLTALGVYQTPNKV